MMVKLNGCIFQLLLTGNIFRIKLVLILKKNLIASLFTIIFFEKKNAKKMQFRKKGMVYFFKTFHYFATQQYFGCAGLFYEL